MDDDRDDAFQAYLSTLAAEMDAGKMTRKQAAVSAKARAHQLFGDPYMDELWAYRVVLADQVERGQTTLEQASYLDERKVNELMERVKASSPASAPLIRPAVRCTPDGYGGIRCR